MHSTVNTAKLVALVTAWEHIKNHHDSIQYISASEKQSGLKTLSSLRCVTVSKNDNLYRIKRVLHKLSPLVYIDGNERTGTLAMVDKIVGQLFNLFGTQTIYSDFFDDDEVSI